MKKLILGFAAISLMTMPSLALAMGSGGGGGQGSGGGNETPPTVEVPTTVYGNYNLQTGDVENNVDIANGYRPQMGRGVPALSTYTNVVIANASNAGLVSSQYSRINGVDLPGSEGSASASDDEENMVRIAYGNSGSISESMVGNGINEAPLAGFDLEDFLTGNTLYIESPLGEFSLFWEAGPINK